MGMFGSLVRPSIGSDIRNCTLVTVMRTSNWVIGTVGSVMCPVWSVVTPFQKVMGQFSLGIHLDRSVKGPFDSDVNPLGLVVGPFGSDAFVLVV